MKKTLSLILSICMLISTLGMPIFAADSTTADVTAYVTVSKYGEILNGKNGETVAAIPIELTGEASYTLDDVFTALHNSCYNGGAESGYATATGDYGLYISKFWGDESENFSYQVNFGSESVMGPNHEVTDGDYVELCINKNYSLDTESYTKFDKPVDEITVGETIELTLTQASYTADGMEFSACSDAVVTVNGTETESVTDADGKVSLTFDETGEYVVSATKTKTVADETVTAISAPFCVVTVNELPEVQMIHNIAEKYSEDSVISDGNMHWFVADLADYLTVYPESECKLTDAQKQACVDKIIELANTATSQSDLAKSIIALRSLGYDAKNTYTKDGEALDIVSKLTALITEESVTAPYYEFTLPYVLIALEQGEGYATQETIEFLINTAVSIKTAWQDTTWGTDGAAPMLRALAPYYETNDDVKTLIDETIDIVTAYQGENGSMGNASSTGLAIAGLAAVGTDPKTVVKNENDLIDGLMADANETLDGFLPIDSTFGTEQGLRGLIAWKLYESGKIIYDFADYPANEARATLETPPTPAPTRRPSYGGSSSVTKKEEATPTPKPEEEKTEGPKPEGLPNKNPDISVPQVINKDKTFKDIENHKNQKAIEMLASYAIIDGMDDTSYCPDNTMTRAQFAAIVVRALGVPQKDGYEFTDVTSNDWFYSYVNTAYHYGIINGVSETEFNPQGEITREEAATMLARAAKLCGMETEIGEDGARNTLAEFPDYITTSDWAMSSVAFCYYEGMLDRSDIEIKPKTETSRAEVAQMLYNMLNKAELI